MAKGGRGCGYGMATEVTECNEVCYAHATVKKGTLAKIVYVPSQVLVWGKEISISLYQSLNSSVCEDYQPHSKTIRKGKHG